MNKQTATGIRIQYIYGSKGAHLCVKLMDDIHTCVSFEPHRASEMLETVLMHCATAAYIRNIRNNVLTYPRNNSEMLMLGSTLVPDYAGFLYVRESSIHRRYGLVAPWVPEDTPLFWESLVIHALVRYNRIVQ